MYSIPSVNSTVQLLQYENVNLVQGSLGIGIMLALFVILMVRLTSSKGHLAFVTALFYTTLSSILWWGMGLLSDYALMFCLILFLASGVWLVTLKDS
jgi:hypothetical protein